MAGYPLPKEKSKCRPMLIVTIDEGKKGEAYLREKGADIRKDTVITIGIEASTANRSWPFEYIKDLTRALIDQGYKVVWLGKEIQYSNKYLDLETMAIGQVNLVGETSLRQAMTIVSLSDLYIGPNSGLMVMATSFKIPTIGLFGAFNPKIRAKFYDRFMAVWKKPKCAPCNEHWTECRHGHPSPCMKMIMPQEIFFLAKEVLAKWPRRLIEKLPIE